MTTDKTPATLATVKHGGCVQLPSPEGQGDARIPFETWAKDYGFDVSKFKGIYNSVETRAAWEAWLYWQRLAARQPVDSTVKDSLIVGGGQPVGEPVAWMHTHKATGRVNFGLSPMYDCDFNETQWDSVALYAAPPAQAVDLGPVRALLQRRIEQWRSHLPADPDAPGTREIETKGEHDYNNDVRIYREGIAVMEEVLAKVGSQENAQ